MSEHHPQSENMKALEQSLNDHMEICGLNRKVKLLRAKNARLKAEVQRLRTSSFVTAVPCEEYDKLKAENKRLRKAGDALEFLVCFNYEGDINEDEHSVRILDAWSAAKDGKPSE